ncbi:hypothetical protein [Clavibacter michiganensis]|uniref:hypothetical protein n=1 Tax=Clavibacter michiganensis TaxID=28447 RepID=UPI000A39AD71|nr:hypothetical protein [Clavibacter michiganensis]MDO4074330.1 hypothetical protein [Clavibacter michiganensis]MDO4098722.1 hypothetical protein [Clavibacter michiganensis]MDO4126593.1 hypothetical protein [Clavibacter michiganensis]MDO4130507.1 hypothetical protein [Clavibacter michiganensis]MDO4136487.1 hypothetical protein [Clavibacter michiganensis]
MNLRWLSAPDDEVTTAMRNVRTSACPPWLPSRREVLAHVDDSLLLLGPLLILIYRGVVTDGAGDGTVTPTAADGLAGAAVVLDV